MTNKEKKIKQILWERGDLTWKLHTGQTVVYNELRKLDKNVRNALVLIARRWGKSYLGAVMAIEDCLRNPGVQVFIVGPDIKQTRRIVTPLIREISKDAPEGLIRQTKSEMIWTIGESSLLIGAFNTALESFRGLEAYSIYLEEDGLADSEEFEYILLSVLGPTLMHSRGRIVHLSTPPKEEDHPLITTILPEAELNNAFFKYTIQDNPLLSKEDIEQEIKAAGGIGSEHCDRELFCKIVRDNRRLILPEFDTDKSVKEIEPPNHTYFITSLDFGGSQDHHAGLIGYFDFEAGKTCIVDEVWLPPNTHTGTILKSMEEAEKRNDVKWIKGMPKRIVDAPDQLLIDLKRDGFVCEKPQKGKDSVNDGIQALRMAFLRGQIYIHPRCTNLIAVCKYGMWDRNREDFKRSEAFGHCDMMAALSYLFRHIDKNNNPFPENEGLSRDTHYFTPKETSRLNESILNSVLTGD